MNPGPATGDDAQPQWWYCPAAQMPPVTVDHPPPEEHLDGTWADSGKPARVFIGGQEIYLVRDQQGRSIIRNLRDGWIALHCATPPTHGEWTPHPPTLKSRSNP